MFARELPLLAESTVPTTAPLDLLGAHGARQVLVVYAVLVVLGLVADAVVLRHLLHTPPRWPDAVRRLARRPWEVADVLRCTGAILLLILGALVLQHLLAHLFHVDLAARPALAVLVQSLTVHLPALLLLGRLLRRRGRSWEGAFGVKPERLLRDVGLGVLLYLAIIPFLTFYSWLYVMFLQGVGYNLEPQRVALALTAESSWALRLYMLFLAAALAPLFEEAFFRGIVLPVTARRWGLPYGMLAVSLLFATIHLHLPSMVALFILAMGFSCAYVYTGSLVVPVVMHGLFNAVNVGLLTSMP